MRLSNGRLCPPLSASALPGKKKNTFSLRKDSTLENGGLCAGGARGARRLGRQETPAADEELPGHPDRVATRGARTRRDLTGNTQDLTPTPRGPAVERAAAPDERGGDRRRDQTGDELGAARRADPFARLPEVRQTHRRFRRNGGLVGVAVRGNRLAGTHRLNPALRAGRPRRRSGAGLCAGRRRRPRCLGRRRSTQPQAVPRHADRDAA